MLAQALENSPVVAHDNVAGSDRQPVSVQTPGPSQSRSRYERQPVYVHRTIVHTLHPLNTILFIFRSPVRERRYPRWTPATSGPNSVSTLWATKVKYTAPPSSKSLDSFVSRP